MKYNNISDVISIMFSKSKSIIFYEYLLHCSNRKTEQYAMSIWDIQMTNTCVKYKKKRRNIDLLEPTTNDE